MKNTLLILVAMLAFAFQSNAQWRTGTTNSDFDEGKKYSYVIGEGSDYTSFVVYEDQEIHLRDFGYFSQYNISDTYVKIRVDKGVVFKFDATSLDPLASNKGLRLGGEYLAMLIDKIKNGSIMAVQTFNGRDVNNAKFNLTGSTKAIDFVGGFQ